MVVGRYVDDGVSGRNALAKRTGGAELLAAAEAHLFDELWVYDPSRLGRNLADMATTVDRLHGLGITIWSVTRGRLDKFQFKLMALLAEDEADRKKVDCANGMNRAAREGRYTGGVVPYGYRVEGVKPNAYLVPDEQTVGVSSSPADVIRHIYQRSAVEGWSCRRIADELNAFGVPTMPSWTDGASVRRTPRGSGGADGSSSFFTKPPTVANFSTGDAATATGRSSQPRVEPLVSDEVSGKPPRQPSHATAATGARMVATTC